MSWLINCANTIRIAKILPKAADPMERNDIVAQLQKSADIIAVQSKAVASPMVQKVH